MKTLHGATDDDDGTRSRGGKEQHRIALTLPLKEYCAPRRMTLLLTSLRKPAMRQSLLTHARSHLLRTVLLLERAQAV